MFAACLVDGSRAGGPQRAAAYVLPPGAAEFALYARAATS